MNKLLIIEDDVTIRNALRIFFYSTSLTITIKKKQKGSLNSNLKDTKPLPETEREGFEPSVRITRTTD